VNIDVNFGVAIPVIRSPVIRPSVIRPPVVTMDVFYNRWGGGWRRLGSGGGSGRGRGRLRATAESQAENGQAGCCK